MIHPRHLILGAGLLLGHASDVVGQSAPADTVKTPAPAVMLECSPALDVYRSEMLDLSHHAGWGMFLGSVVGVAFGIVDARGAWRGVQIIWNAFVGASVGLVVGSSVYVVRRLRGHSPPLRTRCGRVNGRGDR